MANRTENPRTPTTTGFSLRDAKRIAEVVRRTETEPRFEEGQIDPPVDNGRAAAQNWVQITSLTQVSGRYPGTAYIDQAGTLIALATPIWVIEPNGGTLMTGTYYRGFASGVANGRMVYGVTVGGVSPGTPGPHVAKLRGGEGEIIEGGNYIGWDFVVYDTDGFADLLTDDGQFKIPAGLGGYYEFKCNLRWEPDGLMGHRTLFGVFDGVTSDEEGTFTGTDDGSHFPAVSITQIVALLPGSSVTALALVNNASLGSSTIHDAFMSLAYIGPWYWPPGTILPYVYF